ncbi:MAG: hypothetical protein KDB04_15815 [Acidimicrobiales bacterium]|nr:hypothetical protein [Acidimicrobiales bacterium]HRW39626.1 hypothetical protein [Aquihabitans sp.]
MNDADDPSAAPIGGPSWMRHGSAAAAPGASSAPAAIAPDRPVVAPLGPPAAGLRPATPPHVYSRHGASPLPHAALAIASVLALWAARTWAVRGDVEGDRDTLRVLNEIWFTVANLLLPQDRHQDLVSVTKATVVFGLAAVTIVAVVLWVARLGRNLPLSSTAFGGGLALAGLPAWWTLSLTLGAYDGLESERIDLLTRTSLGLAILTAQFLLVRWALLNRAWRAGGLPGDLASILLWLPELVPWAMFFGSSVVTLAATADGERPETFWMPTQAMTDWGFALSKVCMVAIGVLLCVVSVRQHLGMAQERAAEAALLDEERQRRAAPEVTPA